MTHAQNYPGANRSAQWGGTGRPNMSMINKVLLHTTETASWPGYGSFYPTLTFNPWLARGSRWRQHYPVGDAATTLENSGSFQTNRANVLQIEIVAYADLSVAKKYGHAVTDIPADALKELGEFIAWMHAEWEVPFTLYPQWKPYPSSYGANGIRMSASLFEKFQGICGHMHAPGNDHGDPGALDVTAILAYAKAANNDPPFVWDGKTFPGADKFYVGAQGDYITYLGQRLVVHGWTGYSDGPGPTMSDTDVAGVKWFQEKQGWTGSDADGIPGPTTWALLVADPVPVATPPVVVTPTQPTTTPPETVANGLSNFVGVSFNSQWEGFASTQAKAQPWDKRRPVQVAKVAAQKPLVILTQEMGEKEAAQFYADLQTAMKVNISYVRFGPLNTVGWNADVLDYKQVLNIDTPDFGQYPGRGYVEAWLQDKNGNRLRLGSGHNPVKTAADDKYQLSTIEQIVKGQGTEKDDWPLIWGDDTNNKQSHNDGMWAVLKQNDYQWITNGIDAVFFAYGAVVTKKAVVNLGTSSDHDMIVFVGKTTKK